MGSIIGDCNLGSSVQGELSSTKRSDCLTEGLFMIFAVSKYVTIFYSQFRS